MAHNDNPDSGYEHFHTMGKKSPHMGKLVEPLGGGHKAPDSGTKWKGPEGKDTNHKPMNVQRNVPGSGGPGGIVGP